MKKVFTLVLVFSLSLFSIFTNHSLLAQERENLKSYDSPTENLSTPNTDPITSQTYSSYSTKGYIQEGFENSTFPPTGWKTHNAIGSRVWSRSNTVFHSGTASAFIQYEPTSGEDWLITPKILTNSGDSLIFWIRKTYSANYPPDSLYIKYSTDSSIASFSQTLLALDVNSFLTTWTRVALALPAGNGYIAFRNINSNGNGCYIDDIEIGTRPAKDVGIVSINIKEILFKGNNIPRVVVNNFGRVAQSFNVNLSISPIGYSSTKFVTSLSPNVTQEVVFDLINLPVGNYSLVVTTQLVDDENKSNDTLRSSFRTINSFATNIYANRIYNGTKGFVEFNTSKPDSLRLILGVDLPLYAGCWAGTNWYAINATTNQLLTINPLNGAQTTIGTLNPGSDYSFNGLTFHLPTRTLYGIASSITAGGSALFRINRNTAECTLVGTLPSRTFINLASDFRGNIYSVDIVSDIFGRLSPTTGEFTPIGSIGFNANFAQDMEFDHRTGDLVYSAYNATTNKGELRIIDIATGRAYLLGEFEGGAEITALAPPVPAIVVFQPNGGESYIGNSTQQLIFNTETFGLLKTEVTTNNGISWFDAEGSIPMTAGGLVSASWTVPNVNSNQCKIRVRDLFTPTNIDESNETFSISVYSPFKVLSPNGGENWSMGSQHNITWINDLYYSPKLDYSTNGGLSWFTIESNLPITGMNQYSWTIPSTPSNLCIVKITDKNNSAHFDISDNVFTISSSITVSSPNGGESWAAGSQHAISWSNPNMTIHKIDYSTNGGISWFEVANPVPITGMTSYTWTVPNTPSTQCLVKVSDFNSPNNFDISDGFFTITSSNVCKSVNVLQGWNILSVPVTATNMTGTALFPTTISSFFLYTPGTGYQNATTLNNGLGYWAKFNAQESFLICGTDVPIKTISVTQGWNLIGIFSNDVAVSSVTTSPPGIISSNFYEYNNGYLNPSTLKIGKGFWVKVAQNGTMTFPVTLMAKDNFELSNLNLPKIIFTDNLNRTNTLFITKNKIDLSLYELPPPPPDNSIDIRFSSNRMVEYLDGEKDILLNGLVFPIKIKTEGIELKVTDKIDGKQINSIIKPNEELVISSGNINALTIIENSVPKEFSLSQNYPNPFNPTTTIVYDIPQSESGVNVTLQIYDILGRVVQTLVNEKQISGTYKVEWNATKTSSGIYYYELKSGDFRSIKKMILIK